MGKERIVTERRDEKEEEARSRIREAEMKECVVRGRVGRANARRSEGGRKKKKLSLTIHRM